MLKIDPYADRVSFHSPPLYPSLSQKWYGSLATADGAVYCIPHNAPRVLKITPTSTSLVGDHLGEGGWKFHGGLLDAARRKIVGFANNAPGVLIVDLATDETRVVGEGILVSGRHRSDSRYKYLGGALDPDAGVAYLFPCDAERVLAVDVAAEEARLVGPPLWPGDIERAINKFQNGFWAPEDRCCYAIPQRSDALLRIAPGADVRLVPLPRAIAGVKDKFEGGVRAAGKLYAVPLKADAVMVVAPKHQVVLVKRIKGGAFQQQRFAAVETHLKASLGGVAVHK